MTTFDNSKPAIFLDLDQTLISAEAYDEIDFAKKRFKKKASRFNFEDMDGYYIIFERPHLQSFLDYLFANFNVSIWTAASKDYALFIIDKFVISRKPERKINFIFFSYHCDISKKLKNGSKDLSIIWDVYRINQYNKNNTLILDDYDEVYGTQPENCIICPPFYFQNEGSEYDDFLEKLPAKLENVKNRISRGKKNPLKNINRETMDELDF